MSKRGSGSSARAGGGSGGSGAKGRREQYAPSGQAATNARNVENMNEAQLDKEISKLQDKIKNLDASISRNLEEGGYSKAMRDAFPLSSGGAGWSTAGKNRQERERTASLKKAKNYVDARTQKETAAKKLSKLQKAKKQVSGTGKTQSELAAKAKSAAAKSGDALKWKTTNKGGYTADGGYMSKEISAGGFKIRGTSGAFTVYDGAKRIGGASKLSDAKALVEIWRKKKR